MTKSSLLLSSLPQSCFLATLFAVNHNTEETEYNLDSKMDWAEQQIRTSGESVFLLSLFLPFFLIFPPHSSRPLSPLSQLEHHLLVLVARDRRFEFPNRTPSFPWHFTYSLSCPLTNRQEDLQRIRDPLPQPP